MVVFTVSTLALLNLFLCLVVFVFGFLGYRKSKIKLIYYISLAFGLFAVYHLLSLAGFAEGALASITVLAYLVIILPLYTAGRGTLK